MEAFFVILIQLIFSLGFLYEVPVVQPETRDSMN